MFVAKVKTEIAVYVVIYTDNQPEIQCSLLTSVELVYKSREDVNCSSDSSESLPLLNRLFLPSETGNQKRSSHYCVLSPAATAV